MPTMIDRKIFVLIVVLFCTRLLTAQTPGINYQALILNNENLEVPGSNIAQNQVPLSNEQVYFRFSITGDPALDFTQYYEEEQMTETDQNGLVSLIVGEGIPSFSSFNAIVWDGTPKYLNVEIDIVKNGEGYVFLDSQKILYLPQQGVDDGLGAYNGLTRENNTISLGGVLTAPVTIATSPINTLAINNLKQSSPKDGNFVLVDRETGVLKQWESSDLIQTKEKKIIATNGQNQFSTPFPIGNRDKINVYRNGIRIGFIVIDNSTLELESGVICQQDDEIRIVQIEY